MTHQDRLRCLAFSPNCTTLASAGTGDYAILIWDVTGLKGQEKAIARSLSRESLAGLWSDLGSEDTSRAYRAIWKMVLGNEQTIAFLRQHLKPAATISEAILSRLVADLDSNEFQVREKATRELESLGELAETTLRRAFDKPASIEVRRRVEELLRLVPRTRWRNLRGVAVLEHIGTTQARAVLETLVKGGAASQLTQEARTTLERLDRRRALQR